MANRKKRRADGTLRPTVARRRARLSWARTSPERQEWLLRFWPGDRKRFFGVIDLEQAVFLAPFMEALGEDFDQAAAATLLEQVGVDRGWRRLRTKDGLCVGIAPLKDVGSGDGGRVEAAA